MQKQQQDMTPMDRLNEIIRKREKNPAGGVSMCKGCKEGSPKQGKRCDSFDECCENCG